MTRRVAHPESWRAMTRAFLPELRAHRWRLAAGYLCALVGVGASVASPWPLKIIIDHVLSGRPVPVWFGPIAGRTSSATLVLALAIAFVVVITIGAIATTGERVATARVREQLNLALRDRLLAHLQTLPPTIRSAHRSGELVLRLVGDVDLFVRLQTKTLPLLVRYVATGVGTLAMMAWMAPGLAIVSVAVLPALGVVVRRFGIRLGRATREKRRLEGEVAGLAQEIVRGLPAIQALGADQHARARFAALNQRSLRSGVEGTSLTAQMEQWLEIARGVAVALVTGGGALLVLRGSLTVGELTVLGTYIAQLLRPVDKVNDLAEALSRGLAGGERLVALLSQCPLVEDAPGAVPITRARGEIELRDVRFAYPSSETHRLPVLRGANMRLEPGSLGVLVGASGAGKSTILSLLVRLFDSTSGDVLLDGRPLRSYTLRSLRSQIAIMTQDTHLFAGTIRDALSSGNVADDASLWDALALVALDEFVRALPARLDTPLGEDGLDLSGGQRQRLSLARAFLLDRPILLLDEPLANVDPESERVILAALQRLRGTRTCLAITHRLTMLDHADVVYRLEAGRLIAEPRTALANAMLGVALR